MKYLQKIYEMNVNDPNEIVQTIKDILLELNDLNYITNVKYTKEEEKDEIIILIKRKEHALIKKFCDTKEEYDSMIEITERFQRYLFSIDEWRAYRINLDKTNQLTVKYILDKRYK